MPVRLAAATLLCLVFAAGRAADAAKHTLWELHGEHNTVFVLGSIHVLRPSDYPLDAAVLDAYGRAQALVMEIDLGAEGEDQIQSEMLASATLPSDRSLATVLGAARYERATRLARGVGVDLSMFERFTPWFVAEAISVLELAQLGFRPESGVEMYFLDKARADGKPISGLETARDQIALFENMRLEQQSEYLVSSLEQADALPGEIGEMVRAWRAGDTGWFDRQLRQELGDDPALYESLIVERNRKWLPKIEALLRERRNYLVIVGTGHLVGRSSVLALLERDGFSAVQR